MICQNCMSEIDDRATFCPKCGKKIELNPVNNISVKEPEDNKFVSFDVKKHKKLLFSVLFCCLAIASIGIFFATEKENNREQVGEGEEVSNSTVNDQMISLSEEEDDYSGNSSENNENSFSSDDELYLIDYIVIGKEIFNYYNKDGAEFVSYLNDSNGDGYKELYLTVEYSNNMGNPKYYCVDYAKNKIICEAPSSGSSVHKYYISNDDKVYYIIESWATSNGGESIFLYDDGRWVEQARYDRTLLDDVQYYSYFINDKECSENEWNTYKESLKLRDIREDEEWWGIAGVVYDISLNQLNDEFNGYLNRMDADYKSIELDFDKDGAQDYIYAVNNYLQKWLVNINGDSSLVGGLSMFFNDSYVENKLFYLSEYDGETYVYFINVEETIDNLDVADNSNLLVMTGDDYTEYKYCEEEAEAFAWEVENNQYDDFENILFNSSWFMPYMQSEGGVVFQFFSDGSMIYRNYSSDADGNIIYNDDYPEEYGSYIYDSLNKMVYFTVDNTSYDLKYYNDLELLASEIYYPEPDDPVGVVSATCLVKGNDPRGEDAFRFPQKVNDYIENYRAQ